MVSRKKEILDEIGKAEDSVMNAEQIAEAFPFVQDLLRDIAEKLSEVRLIVKGTDEVVPKGQTNIKESMNLISNYEVETLRGE